MEAIDQNKNPGILLIMTGSTASGKDTVIKKLLQKYPDFSKIITTTSRVPRPGEIEGKDYYFVSREKFLQMIEDGKFLETVEYSKNYYGTTKSEIKKVLTGKNMIWKIEATMAARAKKYFTEIFDQISAEKIINRMLVIFITTPDKATLIRRLASRGMREEAIQVRFKTDAENWTKLQNRFEHVIVNTDGKLTETIDQISDLITKKFD
ncbi:MAG: AAA family ATPase [Candidatus Daviesbacteria bacterium]|nr:AAA family ATPase [Candidatus Daviesbacteria bacterium]